MSEHVGRETHTKQKLKLSFIVQKHSKISEF